MNPTSKRAIAKRLKAIIAEKFDNTAFHYAKLSGVKPTSLQKYLDAKSYVGGTNLYKLAVAGGVSCDWILTGQGLKKKRWSEGEANSSYLLSKQEFDEILSHLVHIHALLKISTPINIENTAKEVADLVERLKRLEIDSGASL